MRPFLTFIIALSFLNIQAQSNWCGTDAHMESILQSEAQKNIFEKEMHKIISESKRGSGLKSGNLITIPVVVHNFHNNGDGYITDKQIQDGIRILNEDFQRLNADTSNTRAIFKPYAANVGIQFKLARIDPNGKGTNGIVRVSTPLTENANNTIKGVSRWPTTNYLNIWIVKSIDIGTTNGTTLGYAELPYGGIGGTWGVVQRADTWGTIEESNSDGRTATHEVGHCLGLVHTFQSGCGSTCHNSGDRMCDTPPVFESTQGCDANLNTCSNDASGTNSPFTTDVVNQIENYMSYDNCQNMFSKEQADAMINALTNIAGLVQLTSQPNLVSTGTDSNHVFVDNEPIADFIYSKSTICQNTTVRYTDISYNGTIGTRTWTFPGGSPATSTDSIVDVTYSTVGVFDAKLNVSNTLGMDEKENKNIVDVKSSAPDFTSWFYSEGMEDNNFADKWTVVNNGGNAEWIVSDITSFTGEKCVRIDNFSGNQLGAIDEFISPTYNLNSVLNPELYFKVAYTRRISTNEDALKVYYSTDCGNSWNIRFGKAGSSLETAERSNSPFTPSGEQDWEEYSARFPSSVEESDHVIFKFEFTFDGGNNIYIDDIQIRNPLGVNDLSNPIDFEIFPNPTTENTTVTLTIPENQENVQIAVLDIHGKAVIAPLSYGQLSPGKHKIDIETKNLSSGIYFVQINSSAANAVKKLIVN